MPSLSWIQMGAGAVAAFLLSFLLHTVDIERIEAEQRRAIADQKTQLEQQFVNDKKLTEENTHDYQNKIDALARQLATAKRVQPSRCVVVSAAGAPGGINASPAPTKLPGQDGVAADALYDFAADCEKVRIQVISMQEFENKVWEDPK